MPRVYSTHITRTRTAIGRLTDALEELDGCLKEYAAIGGADALLPFFETTNDANQTVPREDLTFTQPEYVAAVASVDAIRTLLAAGHNTNLYRMKD